MADKSKMNPDELKKTSAAGGTADRARPKVHPVDPVGGPTSDEITDAELKSQVGGKGIRATVSGVTPVRPKSELEGEELRRAQGGAGVRATVSGTSPVRPKGELGGEELRRAQGGAQNADVRRLKADKYGGDDAADTKGGIEPH